jgi:hypothetical protein
VKDDGLTVDAMGVRQGLRRLGLGAQVAAAFIERARTAAQVLAGPPEYLIDSVPGAVAFWRGPHSTLVPFSAVLRPFLSSNHSIYPA